MKTQVGKLSLKSVQRLVYKFMFMSPILLIGGIGVNARVSSDPFEPIGYTPIGQQRILAYRDLVGETMANVGLKTTPAVAISLSDKWLASYKAGNLQPIYAASEDDSIQDGIRGEIFQSVTGLDDALFRHAKRAAAKGDIADSKVLLIHALELAEIVKYSDFTSLNMLRMDQTRALKKLNSLKVASAADRHEIANHLKTLLANQRSLDGLAVIVREQYSQSQAKAGLEPVSIEDPLANAEGRDLRSNNQVFLVSQNDAMPEVHSAIRFGYQYEEQFKTILEKSIVQWSDSVQAATKPSVQ